MTGATLENDLVRMSPPRSINSETSARSRIETNANDRIIQALRCEFTHKSATQGLAGLTILTYDVGSQAMTPGNFSLAWRSTARLPTKRISPNRAPGDIKPSHKWSLDRRNGPSPTDEMEFRQALFQANYYMILQHSRYRFLITNLELVAIKRLDDVGNLEVSDSIPWASSGTSEHPQLTILLGLWYLGMLAADDQNWFLED